MWGYLTPPLFCVILLCMRKVQNFTITYLEDGNRKRLKQMSVKAFCQTSAKTKFVDQGYGVLRDIIDIEVDI